MSLRWLGLVCVQHIQALDVLMEEWRRYIVGHWNKCTNIYYLFKHLDYEVADIPLQHEVDLQTRKTTWNCNFVVEFAYCFLKPTTVSIKKFIKSQNAVKKVLELEKLNKEIENVWKIDENGDRNRPPV